MIYLVRHGETVWNAEQRRQGRGDSPLTEKGIAQSRALGRTLKTMLEGEKSITLVTSPAGRSRRTAAIIAEELGIAHERIQTTPLLQEMDFGGWQGLTDAEIATQFPEQWRERELNRWFFVYPDGESYPVLCSRVAQWMETAQNQSGVIVAVTHQWTSRAIRGQYLRLPKEDMFELMHVPEHIIELRNNEQRVFRVQDED